MSITKMSQGQVRGTGTKADLAAEIAAIETAIAGALGKSGSEAYTAGADISLAYIAGKVDALAAVDLTAKVDLDMASHAIKGVTNIAAGSANLGSAAVVGAVNAGSVAAGSAAVAGLITAASAVVAGSVTAASAVVSGQASVGALLSSGDVTVGGKLIVNGTTTTVNSQTLEVADSNIVIAKGSLESALDGAGFSLMSDSGSHFMHWNAAAAKWQISDGMMTSGVLAAVVTVGGKLVVGDASVTSAAADDLMLAGGQKVVFKDKFMPAGGLDLSATGDYSNVFGATKWGEGLSLVGALNKEHNDRITAVAGQNTAMLAAVAAEQSRALGAEAGLLAAIETESTNRSNADLAHDQAIAAEVLRATNAETGLQAALSAEVTTRTNNFNTVSSALAAEVTRATGAETALQTALSAEVTRATGAEGALDVKIVAETSRATVAEQGLQSAINATNSALAAEVTRATGAESVLTGNLAAEVTRATTKENALELSISNEVTRATGAEGLLTSNLAAEVTRATGAELAISNNLAAEIANRVTAVADLRTAVETGAGKLYSQKAPNGGFAANSVFAIMKSGSNVLFAKTSPYYDVYLNGQKMSYNDDWAFVPGFGDATKSEISFKFAIVKDDVLEVREHGV